MNIRIPSPVPATPSASTDAAASQPGSSPGACARPKGRSAIVAPVMVAVESVIGSSLTVWRWSRMLASA